jgi:hypothetical protein
MDMRRLTAFLLVFVMALSVMPTALAQGLADGSSAKLQLSEPNHGDAPASGTKVSDKAVRTVTGSCGAELAWSFDPDSGILAITGTGAMYDYNDSDNKAPWNEYAAQILSIEIENGVASVGAYAFDGCTAIKEIFLPASIVSIGDHAFSGCSAMFGVGMQEGVETIGTYAFSGCSNISRVYIPASVTVIGDYAFQNCSRLYYFWVFGPAPAEAPQHIFQSANTYMSIYCFADYYSGWYDWGYALNKYVESNPAYYCGSNSSWSYDPATQTITISGTGSTESYDETGVIPPWYAYTHETVTVTFAEGSRGMGSYAFRNFDRLTTLNIPASMTNWGTNAFKGCYALSNISVDPANTEFALIDGVVCGSSSASYIYFCPSAKTGAYVIPAGTYGIMEGAFCYTGITSVEIPSSLSVVAPGSFVGNTDLTEFIGTASSIKAIDGVLFQGQTLKVYPQGRAGEYTVPSDVTYIEKYAFYGADGITRLSAPGASLSQIMDYAFYNCASITEVTLYSPNVQNYAFAGCSNLETVTFMGPKPGFYADCFSGASPNFKIRYSAAYASSWAPNGETTITVSGVVIPLEEIPVTTIPCGDDLSYYYDEAANKLSFFGTGDMYDYNGTDNMPPWHSYASEITALVLPEGMTGIGEYAFLDCNKLNSVTLPASLESLGLHAFKGCTALQTIYKNSGNNGLYVYSNAVYSYDRTTLIFNAPRYANGNPLLSSCTAIGPYAYEGAIGPTNVTLSSNIVSIGEGAYEGCPNLTKAVIPESVTSIGANAFKDCPLLASVTINGAQTVGNEAFAGCSALTEAIFLCEPPTSFGTDVFSGCAAGFKIRYLRDYASSWAPNGETTWNGYPIESYRLPNPSGTAGNMIWEYDYETHILYLSANGYYTMSSYSATSRPSWDAYKDEIVGVEMSDKVLSVGQYAFYNYTALEWVHFNTTYNSSSVVINQYAFSGCTSLSEFTVPRYLYKIDQYAFKNCSSLTSFYIPRGCSNLSYLSFVYAGIESITVDPYNSTYASYDGVVYTSGYSSLFYIPEGRTGTVEVMNGVTSVTQNAAFNTRISGLVFPATLTSIAASAIRNDPNLESVLFLGSKPSAGSSFFVNCASGLTFYYLAENASAWAPSGETTWQGFPIEVWQGEVPTPIGQFTQYLLYTYDEATRTITIFPKEGYTDTSSSQTSFSGCSWYSFRTEIEHAVIEASVPCVPDTVFNGWSSLCDFTVDPANTALTAPGGVLYTADMTKLICYPAKKTGTEYTIPDGVTNIVKGAFAGNEYIEQVTIPASVTRIGNEAFKGCTSLREAAFLGLPPSSFGSNVFADTWRYFRVAYPAEYADNWAPGGATKWNGYTAVPIGTPPYDPTSCGESLHYSFDEDTGVLRIYGTGAMYAYNNTDNIAPWRTDYPDLITSIVIEDGVTTIAPSAFRGLENAASVMIGNSVETIGAYAFYGCPITSVTIGNSVETIDGYAFYGCAMTSVDLPASLISFTRTSFGGNDDLAAINIDAGNALYSSINGVVFNKDKDTLLLFPRGKAGAYTVPAGTAAIEAYAFSEAQAITSVTFPSTLLTVGSYAFYACPALEAVNMTSSQLLEIPQYMCSNCQALTSVSFSNATVSIGENAFVSCTSLASIILGSSVETVGRYAFSGCTGAVTVFIPASVRTIDERAFCDCTLLTNLNIAEGLVTIGQSAFSYCGSLESVTFPTTVDDIGGWAFTDCSNLKSATFKGGHPYSFGNYVFSNCADGFCIFYTHAYAGEWNPEGDTVTWRDYPIHEELPCEPFGACDEDTEWDYDYANHVLYIRGSGDMPNYLPEDTVPWAPFINDIHAVIVEAGVTSVGTYSFAGMTMLYEATIPDGVIQIPTGCFEGCAMLGDIYFPSSVTSIASDAFNGCTSLYCFYFPSTVTAIGVRAFYGSGLYEAEFEGQPPINFGAAAFDECDEGFHILADAAYLSDWDGDGDLMWNGYTVWFHGGDFCGPNVHWTYNDASNTIYFSGTGEMYEYLEGTAAWALSSSAPWNDYRQEIEHAVFMNGITYISSGCFSSFPNLRDVYIAGSVKGMGTHAFYDVALDSITIEEGLEWISFWSFSAMSVPVIVFPETFRMLPQEGVDCCDVQEVYFLGDCPFQDELDYQPFRGTGCVVYYYSSHRENWEAAFRAGLGCNKPCYMVYDPNDNTCGDLTWSFDENTGTLSFYGTGAMEDYFNNTPWYQHLEEILYVSLPEGVTHIGDNAFAGCVNLESLTIPSTVESIGAYAFCGCGLTSVSFPASVTSIGVCAFTECSCLTSVTIPATVTEVGEGAFEQCDNLEEAYLPYLTEIPDYLFASCTSLETVELCDNAVSIGDYAFAWCNNLTDVEMPSALVTIGEGAFQCCSSIVSIELPEGLETIGGAAFIECYSLHDIAIPSTVTEIGGSAFYECQSLESIEIPAGVTEIESCTFMYCYALTSVTLHEGLEVIGVQAFDCCYNLVGVRLPSTLTEIGNYAFSDTGLRRVTIPAGCRTFGQGVFCWCSNLSLIIVDGPVMTDEEIIDDFLYGVDNSVVIGYYPDYESSWAPNGETEWYDHPLMRIDNDNEPCGDALTWSLSGGVLTIAGTGEMYSFTVPTGGCPAPWADQMASITSIVIEEGVETVGAYAFYGCTGITELYLPDGLWGVMAHAFENCTSLVSVSFPASCQGVDDYGFCGCTSLTDITFREGQGGGGDAPISKGLYDDSQLSYIGAYAFFGTGLTRVVLPASVSYIGYRAFGYCEDLICVTFEGCPPNLEEEAFVGAASGFHIEYLPEYADDWAPDGETEWEGYPICEQGETAYYTVTFVDHDGTVLSTQSVAFGEAAQAPADPSREGWTFVGWDTDFSCVTGDLIVTALYVQNTPEPTVEPTATPEPTVEPTATPEPTPTPTPELVYYTVTFVDWDGTVISTQQVEEGEAAQAPADPEREGWTFIGWDTDFSSVTENLTVTALYEENVPPVTIVPGDVDCNGLVNMADLALAASYVQNSGNVSAQGILNGDMNGDGAITAADLAALYQLILG